MKISDKQAIGQNSAGGMYLNIFHYRNKNISETNNQYCSSRWF